MNCCVGYEVKLYGIPNCDKVRAAKRWLESHDIDYSFHDFKKEGLTVAQLSRWLHQQPLSQLLNKRSTTWRQLPPEVRAAIEQGDLAQLAARPTLIKRPVLEASEQLLVGFDPQSWQRALS